jgi:anti-sigma B factor antagonist
MTIDVVDGPGNGPRLVRAAGEFDVGTVPALLPQVRGLVAGATGVVLDLTAVTFLDSSGVRFVDRLAKECGSLKTPFRVVVPPGHRVRRVLEIVGFGPPLVADDLTEGLDAIWPASS